MVVIAATLLAVELISLPFNDWNIRKMNWLGFNAHIVASGSMIPEFKPGDITLTYKYDFDSIQEGDIITYLHNGKIIVHRVIEKTSSYAVTKGDNNPSPDDIRITESNYLGKVVCHTNF